MFLQVAKNSEVIFLAVKPQFVSTVLKEIKQHLTDQHIVVSIAAGIPLAVMKVRPDQQPVQDWMIPSKQCSATLQDLEIFPCSQRYTFCHHDDWSGAVK